MNVYIETELKISKFLEPLNEPMTSFRIANSLGLTEYIDVEFVQQVLGFMVDNKMVLFERRGYFLNRDYNWEKWYSVHSS